VFFAMRSIPTSNHAHRDHVIEGDSIPEAWWNGTRMHVERVAKHIHRASVGTWDEYKHMATPTVLMGLGAVLLVLLLLVLLIAIVRRRRIKPLAFRRRTCLFCARCVPGSPDEHFVHPPCKHVECLSRHYAEKSK